MWFSYTKECQYGADHDICIFFTTKSFFLELVNQWLKKEKILYFLFYKECFHIDFRAHLVFPLSCADNT